jgi:hypothetical protein
MGDPRCYCSPTYVCAACFIDGGHTLPACWRPTPKPRPTVLTMGPETPTGEDDCGGPTVEQCEDGTWLAPRSDPESWRFDPTIGLDWYRAPAFSVLRRDLPWCPAPTPRST